MNIEHLELNLLLEFLTTKKEGFKTDRHLKNKILVTLKEYIYKLV